MIVTGAPVERILVEGGRVQGVLLADGTELAAPTVVSNADPKRTLLGARRTATRSTPRLAAAIEAYAAKGRA